jgi:4-aminobutyrate aminotransferase
MLGVEMVSAPNKPDGDRAARILKHCEQNGMLMLRCGSHGQVVRWLPPLTVTEAEMEQAVNLFEAALKET